MNLLDFYFDTKVGLHNPSKTFELLSSITCWIFNVVGCIGAVASFVGCTVVWNDVSPGIGLIIGAFFGCLGAIVSLALFKFLGWLSAFGLKCRAITLAAHEKFLNTDFASAAAPVAKAPEAPVAKAPVAPVAKAPEAPVAKAPAAPVTKAPAASVTKAPEAPVAKAPAAPVTKAPAAPVAKAPAAPAKTEMPKKIEFEYEKKTVFEYEQAAPKQYVAWTCRHCKASNSGYQNFCVTCMKTKDE